MGVGTHLLQDPFVIVCRNHLSVYLGAILTAHTLPHILLFPLTTYIVYHISLGVSRVLGKIVEGKLHKLREDFLCKVPS